MHKFAQYLNHFQFKKILDVGTGNGHFIKMIASVYDGYEEMIGIDTADIAISTSEKNFSDERIRFVQADAYHTDFPDDSFDMICISNTIHHLQSIDLLFKELERLLSDGGIIMVNEMISNGLNKRQKGHMLIHHFAAKIDRLQGEYHEDTYRDKDLLSLLSSSSDLQIKDIWPVVTNQEEENTKEEIEWLLKTLDKLTDKRLGENDHKSLQKEAEKIKKHILKHGFESAAQLMVVLK
jgi:ubiquinone/menaquinone biosynthesis C-methylase UbiE